MSGRPTPAIAADVDQWNVSLKLRHSGVPEARRLDPTAIDGFRRLGGARVFWKFVVGHAEHVQEAAAVVERFGLAREQVLLMPLTLGRDANQRGVDELVWNACVERGYRYTPRAARRHLRPPAGGASAQLATGAGRRSSATRAMTRTPTRPARLRTASSWAGKAEHSSVARRATSSEITSSAL